MSRNATDDFLVEIGTEELPPKALEKLVRAFADNFAAALDGERLAHGAIEAFASPRRLALKVGALATAQDDRETEQKGPPVSVAFDEAGNATRAAQAFARKCGVEVTDLERGRSAKGEWLVHRAMEKGCSAATVLPGLVRQSLADLPVPRRMRWGAGDAEFVRPVHWVVMLHGADEIAGKVLGIAAGRDTRGHRFHAPGPLTLESTDDYPAVLANPGYVVADFASRRRRILDGVRQAARDAGGTAVGDDALYDEVTALTEWPVAMIGRYDESFLALPGEVIAATLTGHQRYFPVSGRDGRLIPKFIMVANLESREPDKVRDGNERVIGPRLADAAFFWESDQRTTLAARRAKLGDVVYRHGLGSLLDKSGRVAALAARIARAVGADAELAMRSGELAKCDLLTGMVGEFPELQGVMGRYYALADGEPGAVADALGEQYLPRHAGDELPQSAGGRILSIADRLDTVCGIFALGQKPSGNRDPFGLRRAALGVVRITVEARLDLDLPSLIETAVALQPARPELSPGREIYEFIIDRMRGLWLERDGVTSEMFEAVRCRRLPMLTDIDERLRAVVAFVQHDAAESLAAANKRIVNILRQADYADGGEPDTELFDDEAEQLLYASLDAARKDIEPLLRERRYTRVLERLAELRQPVDAFFDRVMVMADDDAVKRNRLALLAQLRAQFLNVADISRLSIGKG